MTDGTVHPRIATPPAAGVAVEAMWLRAATTFFAIAVLLHNGDHLRRGGDSIASDVFAAGTAAILLEVAVVFLVFARHPAAPLTAVAVGFPLALGYLFVHFTPDRSWLSDSFPSGDPSPLSWAAASLETTAALALGVAGAVILRRTGLAAAANRARYPLPISETLRHPVVMAMIVGNALLLVATVADRAG